MHTSDLEAGTLPASATTQYVPGSATDGAVPVMDPTDQVGMPARVARAGTWGLAGRTILLLANFGATPFTIRLLGPSAYGLWALIQAILVWAGPAEGGQGTATTKYGAERYAEHDAVGESKVIWSGLCFALFTTSSVGLALGLGARSLLEALNVSGRALGAGVWALRLASGTFVIASVAGAINTAQQVRLRWKQYTLLNVFSNLLGAIGVPLAIYFSSGGVVAAAMVGLAASLLYFIGLSWDALRVQPRLRRPRLDGATLRLLIPYGGALALANLANVGLNTGERFLLAGNASTTAVAYYAVAMTIATTLSILPEQLVLPLMPALTRLHTEGKAKEFSDLYGKSLSALFLLVTPATIVVALVAKPFLTLWAGRAYGEHGTLLLLVALVGVWANALGWVPDMYLLSVGKANVFAALQGGQLVLYLGAAWVLTERWGALGAALVWSSGWVVYSVLHLLVARRLGRLPVNPLSERRMRCASAPVLLGASCMGVATLTGGLVGRMALAAVLLVVYAFALWWFVLTARERVGVCRLLGDMVGREVRLKRRKPADAR